MVQRFNAKTERPLTPLGCRCSTVSDRLLGCARQQANRGRVRRANGRTLGHHDLSRHGKDPGKLKQLKIVEQATLETLRDFLAKLKQTEESGSSLLDRTMVFLVATWATPAVTRLRTCWFCWPAAAFDTANVCPLIHKTRHHCVIST